MVYSLRFWLALKKANLKKNAPIITTLSSIRHGSVEEWPARIIGSQLLNRLPDVTCVQCSSEKFKMLKAGISKNKLRIVFHPLVLNLEIKIVKKKLVNVN